MKPMYTIIILFLYSFYSFELQAWDIVKSENGIQVFTRDVAGSNLKEFKAIMTVDVEPDRVLSLIQDGNSMSIWWPDCIESKVISGSGTLDWKVYFMTKVPFPLENRDTINHFMAKKDSNSKVISIQIKGIPETVPTKSEVVRIPKLTGSWTISPKETGTEIIYQLHADPGGSIPAFVANSTVVDGPLKTFQAMKQKLK